MRWGEVAWVLVMLALLLCGAFLVSSDDGLFAKVARRYQLEALIPATSTQRELVEEGYEKRLVRVDTLIKRNNDLSKQWDESLVQVEPLVVRAERPQQGGRP